MEFLNIVESTKKLDDNSRLTTNFIFTAYNHLQNKINKHYLFFSTLIVFLHQLVRARCISVVRAFAYGAMGHRINPSW